MTLDIPQPLLDDISKVRASLVLGAGASCEAGLLSSSGLANYLIEAAGSSYKTLIDRPLDFVAQHLYMKPGYGKQWIRQKLIEYFERKHREVKRPPTPAHEILTKIRWRTIFTTNYDRLIEIAYDSNPELVQRLLPIYTPDPQIQRHEAEVVR